MLKAYQYRLYPNKTQQQFLNQIFGDVRFLWNKLVENFNSYSSHGPNRPMNEKILKDDPNFPWLKEGISYALQQKRNDFEETKRQFFNKNRKKKLGKMKFKKKGISKDSFRIPFAQLTKGAIDLDNGKLKLPKMNPMKMIADRKFTGEPRNVTISKNKCNQYFVSILIEEKIELKRNTGKVIGIDLGINHLMAFNNGDKIKNPRWFCDSQAKLKKAQRHLSRKKKGSNRYLKQKIKVAKIHLKIRNQRKFTLHNITTGIVNHYDIIVMENLNVEGMKKGKLGKSVSDSSFATIVYMLKYKCDWYGKTFHLIDRWFPSSKLCSSCGHKNEELKRSDRGWKCSSCGAIHDRDINAAKNILNKGLNDLYGIKSEELPDLDSFGILNRHGEAVRLFRCLHLESNLVEVSNNYLIL